VNARQKDGVLLIGRADLPDHARMKTWWHTLCVRAPPMPSRGLRHVRGAGAAAGPARYPCRRRAAGM
jgi:hypothetical protein